MAKKMKSVMMTETEAEAALDDAEEVPGEEFRYCTEDGSGIVCIEYVEEDDGWMVDGASYGRDAAVEYLCENATNFPASHD